MNNLIDKKDNLTSVSTVLTPTHANNLPLNLENKNYISHEILSDNSPNNYVLKQKIDILMPYINSINSLEQLDKMESTMEYRQIVTKCLLNSFIEQIMAAPFNFSNTIFSHNEIHDVLTLIKSESIRNMILQQLEYKKDEIITSSRSGLIVGILLMMFKLMGKHHIFDIFHQIGNLLIVQSIFNRLFFRQKTNIRDIIISSIMNIFSIEKIINIITNGITEIFFTLMHETIEKHAIESLKLGFHTRKQHSIWKNSFPALPSSPNAYWDENWERRSKEQYNQADSQYDAKCKDKEKINLNTNNSDRNYMGEIFDELNRQLTLDAVRDIKKKLQQSLLAKNKDGQYINLPHIRAPNRPIPPSRLLPQKRFPHDVISRNLTLEKKE